MFDYTQYIFQNGLLALFLYFTIFIIVGIWKTGYFKKNPLEDGEPEKIADFYSKTEDKSNVLAGSALIALTFIITIFKNNLGEIEPILTFFSLAFVFEVISAFLYHHITKNIYGYLGMVCQYAGVIALLFGFENYLLPTLSWSLAITLIFPISIAIIIGLTLKELMSYIKYFQSDASDV